MPNSNSLWYKDSVIYQVHVKTFSDGNGDGIGDFKGLTSKLDYIQSLGANLIWVMPFYLSPLRDDGYDVADYKNVNPRYGTLEDFSEFLNEAHRRGIKVLTELIMNHTSDQHEWFQKSRRAKPGDPWRDFYIWSDTDQKHANLRIIFMDYETSNWEWDEEAKAYYLHRFFKEQPDLNYDNPEVLKAMLDVVDFWLGMGVDGFRLDAITYLIKREGTDCEGLPETHAIIKKIRAHIDSKYKDKILLAEACQPPHELAKYFGSGNDEFHLAYNFPLVPRIYLALAQGDKDNIEKVFNEMPSISDRCQWVMFLRNHDALLLGMISPEDREKMFEFYCKDFRFKHSDDGIIHRLAPLMENDRARIEAINIALFSLPGSPIIYYGDEIGMGDERFNDRDGVRTPMQWNAGKNAGFSTADSDKLILPIINQPGYTKEEINVEQQESNPHSLLNWTRHILKTRFSTNVFGRGSIKFLQCRKSVLSFILAYGNEVVLVVLNLSDRQETLSLDLSHYSDKPMQEMISNQSLGKASSSAKLDLPAYGYKWVKIG